ncbi:hypothetical protein HBN50_08205 [Halobacteriovorax sp. GB3]|uniref:hypothetical protein n=1 Tax=Halobacteriovorax sp. GB3 TaxID=2719615 RepID=UPI00236083C2|nr:hypothetical protein [Halobacteriovorax sp. GB3]MDD0853075.1 hypothetical protein [Halobacteriovorax sp. GB3]
MRSFIIGIFITLFISVSAHAAVLDIMSCQEDIQKYCVDNKKSDCDFSTIKRELLSKNVISRACYNELVKQEEIIRKSAVADCLKIIEAVGCNKHLQRDKLTQLSAISTKKLEAFIEKAERDYKICLIKKKSTLPRKCQESLDLEL